MKGNSCAPSCPPVIRIHGDKFKDILGKHYKAFIAVLCGYCYGFSSLSDIVRYLLFSPSLSAMSRFFNDKNMSNKLNRRQRRMVQSLLRKNRGGNMRYLWALDDTLLPHYGKQIWGTYWWFDHCSKSNVYGHKLLVLGIVDTKKNIFIPVKWEILHREDKKSSSVHEKGWEVGIRLLQEVLREKFPKVPFVADSWFACEEAFIKLDALGVDFVMEVKNNRIVTKHGHKFINKPVKNFFLGLKKVRILFKGKTKWASSAILKFNGSVLRLKTVAVSNKKSVTTSAFSYYVCNKLTWDESRIWSIARYRWSIEVQFRDLKQFFALGEAAVRSKSSVEINLSISMIALTVVRQLQIEEADASKNQYGRPKPVSDIVNDFKLNSFNTLVSKLASKGEKVLLCKFRSRLNKKNLKNKPTVEYDEVS